VFVDLDGFKTLNAVVSKAVFAARTGFRDWKLYTNKDAARDTARWDARFKAAFIDERPTIQERS